MRVVLNASAAVNLVMRTEQAAADGLAFAYSIPHFCKR
ncbi:MAG: hypothetical protein AzoDbin1_01790 [Azoarcus sp.]|uniref:Uncharacterized protein n=1 Tax=Aromatoleum tolulyticum TaxID=34027 RepID=A0A1N6Z2X6_9RHOO|nr:hypothetical protein [Azoarcus sp.]SIR21147.1 hypothetical protein SAMN05421829_11169 [Aromatoleum tolulyticum]